MSLIQRIANQAYKTILSCGGGSGFSENVKQLVDITKKLTAKDLNIDPRLLEEQPSYFPNNIIAPVTYINIWEDENFTMGVFILKPETRLPLHDHPQMHGFIKVIHGSCSVTSFSPGPKELDTSSFQQIKRSLIKVNEKVDNKVTAHSDPILLTPNVGNCHEIRSTDGTIAFLDILFPPYDDNLRPCNYYKLCGNEGKQYLTEISPPTDYWTELAKYTGPCIDDELVYRSC